VIGAGPAGLTYASLVADGNKVTVFEKESKPGGSFRYAGKAPLFQEVAANQKSFDRYIADLFAACEAKGVAFRFGSNVTASSEFLVPFDRIVIATGAAYRFGLGLLIHWALDGDSARAPGFWRLLSSERLRNWFYYRARRGTAEQLKPRTRPGQMVAAIGDAAGAGKSKQAIASAFQLALRGT
jgi:hypothetical protein